MSVTSGFYNSLNGDRRYSAEQMSNLIDSLINDGVFASVGTAFSVTAGSGNNINVGIGRAWFYHSWLYNDAILPLAISPSEVLLDRIDAVVIEINRGDGVRAGSIKVVTGSASSDPQRPTLLNEGEVRQYPLAYIRCRAGSSEIVQGDITNMVGTSSCPYVNGILETQSIDSIVAQWQDEFNTWMEDLDSMLDGDAAANLASRILAVESKFDTLAKERTIYSDLQDANLNNIQDSSGRTIEGRTVMAAEGEGGENVVYLSGSSGTSKEEVDDFKVGDILLTKRTDLSDKWLLTNGETIDIKDYPMLDSVLPYDMADPIMVTSFTMPSGFNTTYKMAYLNNQYIVIGQRRTGTYPDYTYYASLAYSNTIYGPWTFVDLYSSAHEGGYCSIRDIIYADDYYVAVGQDYDGTNYHATLCYTDSLGGSWTRKNIWSAPYFRNIANAVAYGEISGRFLVVGCYQASETELPYASVASSTSLSGSFSRYGLEYASYSHYQCEAVDITYGDGRFAIACDKSVLTSSVTKIIFHKEDSTSWSNAWARIQYGPNGTDTDLTHSFPSSRECIAIVDGYLFLVYGSKNGVGSKYGMYVSRTVGKLENNPGTFYSQNIPSGDSGNGVYTALCVSHLRGTIYVASGDKVYSALLNTVTSVTEETEYDNAWSECQNARSSSGNLYLLDDILTTKGWTEDLDIRVLPTISLSDDAYTYIKAKED